MQIFDVERCPGHILAGAVARIAPVDAVATAGHETAAGCVQGGPTLMIHGLVGAQVISGRNEDRSQLVSSCLELFLHLSQLGVSTACVDYLWHVHVCGIA